MQKTLKLAERRRKAFMSYFKTHGVKAAQNNPAKLYTGELSPGCIACMQGQWSCLYINGLCTRNCFYCPQDRTWQKERLPMPHDEDTNFRSPADYVRYLKAFNFKGIGISGGEPFLAFDRVVDYLQEIRKSFRSRFYTWIYTNGDLVTEDRLAQLKKLGLNEIRFDISANHYDLSAVRLAARQIETVTIEIPAIPEDAATVVRKLRQIESAGVKHLNIHQLMVSEHNRKALRRRGYTLLTGPYAGKYIPVLESELAAFEILKAAAGLKLRTSVNYCSTCYKARFQGSAFNRRYAAYCQDPHEVITETGYLRRLSLDRAGKSVISAGRLRSIARRKTYAPVFVTYFSPLVKRSSTKNTTTRQVLSFGTGRFNISRTRNASYDLSNATSAILFQHLFVEHHSPEETTGFIIAQFELPEEDRRQILEDIQAFYQRFKMMEVIPDHLPLYHPTENKSPPDVIRW